MDYSSAQAGIHRRTFLAGAAATGVSLALAPAAATAAGRQDGLLPVGVAKIDVTPDYPVRLPGYAGRTTESEGVLQRLWAKALAIGGDEGDGPALLLTLDNCGAPQNVTDRVAEILAEKAGVRPERVVICSTHTHTAPWLDGFLPLHYVEPIPSDHQQHIRRYTDEATGQLARVALQALNSRTAGRLAWSEGRVSFAANRRVLQDGKWKGFGVNPDGPVDHSLPVLRVTDSRNKVLALLVNYACHCTTMNSNSIHGDWAGCAQSYLEQEHPGVVAMISIGCGADLNPEPRGSTEATEQHGRALADEVERVLGGSFTPLTHAPSARIRRIELPFDRLPTREELEQRLAAARAPSASSRDKRNGFHAQWMLEQIRREGKLPETLPYRIAVWTFGEELAMVFLPGEVVVDYVVKLKELLDRDRLWVTAYANDVPCYIPSARLLEEGGYETDTSMVSYAQPTRFAPAVEKRIVNAVTQTLASSFGASQH
jgi:hypothetical protein